MMMILKRYVLKKFVQVYLLTISGFVCIFLLIDFFERADEFVVRKALWEDWVGYYLYKVPLIFSYMAPQAVLLATVVTLTAFARNNEFTAMKACGIGVTGITMPILAAAVVVAGIVLASNEYVMPSATEKMNYIFQVKVRHAQDKGPVERDKLWFRSANGTIWNIDYFDPERALMKKVSVFLYNGRRAVEQRIDATAAFWNGREWEFLDGYVRDFSPTGLSRTEYFKNRVFPAPESPADFKKVQKKPEEMSAREMYRVIQAESTMGKDTEKKWVDLHRKLSYPFMSVILGLIGIPLSLRTSRTGGVLFCVAVSLAVGLAFSFIYALGISLGHGGTFGPLLAAWGPLLLFGSLGFYMILTLDSEKILPL
ncbi:MAG: LPS export ABC transporter permease LptG [Nitrospinae bacterium]|nr:LPS export ABC transporter permease LptG [Nitrospinota bacterium]